jgi:hypothetical protein
MKRTFHLCPRCGSPDISLRVVDIPSPDMSVQVLHRQAQEICPQCGFIASYVKFTCDHCNPDAFATCPHADGGTPTAILCFAP